MRLASDWRECYEAARLLLKSQVPFFFGRIGGSDTDAAMAYHAALQSADRQGALAQCLASHLPVVKRYNGFYDKNDEAGGFFRYCEHLTEQYRQCRHLIVCNSNLLSTFFPGNLHPDFLIEDPEADERHRAYLASFGGDRDGVSLYPYNFVEKLVFDSHTLFRAFSEGLNGKRVLVVSPFSKSIEANFHNRREFFRKDYVYPDFELATCTTPITYDGLPIEYYPHDSWFETAEALKQTVAAAEFDVALLACGTYAMPIGNFVEKQLGRKAIYVGGVLQLYFGVMGRRYENPFFLDQINREVFTYPVESTDYMQHVKVGEGAAREAFGAYF